VSRSGGDRLLLGLVGAVVPELAVRQEQCEHGADEHDGHEPGENRHQGVGVGGHDLIVDGLGQSPDDGGSDRLGPGAAEVRADPRERVGEPVGEDSADHRDAEGGADFAEEIVRGGSRADLALREGVLHP
jgi:hypothetical protein